MNNQNNNAINTEPRILSELNNYKKKALLDCLQCKYKGLMGFKKKIIPWYLTLWVLIPLCFTGIGTIPAILLGMWRFFATKEQYVCPNCLSIIEKGPE